jgi:hypothetical protein
MFIKWVVIDTTTTSLNIDRGGVKNLVDINNLNEIYFPKISKKL